MLSDDLNAAAVIAIGAIGSVSMTAAWAFSADPTDTSAKAPAIERCVDETRRMLVRFAISGSGSFDDGAGPERLELMVGPEGTHSGWRREADHMGIPFEVDRGSH